MTKFYMHEDGQLSHTKPESGTGTRSFLYDPSNPCPTIGAFGSVIHLFFFFFFYSWLSRRVSLLPFFRPSTPFFKRLDVWFASPVSSLSIGVRL